jgi:hypothetical protein
MRLKPEFFIDYPNLIDDTEFTVIEHGSRWVLKADGYLPIIVDQNYIPESTKSILESEKLRNGLAKTGLID